MMNFRSYSEQFLLSASIYFIFITLYIVIIGSFFSNDGIYFYSKAPDFIYQSKKTTAGLEVNANSRSIYFAETSGRCILSERQLCSLESAARANPDMPVRVLMICKYDKNSDLMNRMYETYPNIFFEHLDAINLLQNTPLKDWMIHSLWKQRPYKASQLSNAVRLVVVWKYGGIYLDLDVITVQPLAKFRNALIREDPGNITSSVLIFDKRHPFLRSCLEFFAVNFRAFEWTCTGPAVLTRVLKEKCSDRIEAKNEQLCDVSVLPHSESFPVSYGDWKLFFKKVGNLSKYISIKTYVVHLWNRLSSKEQVILGEGALFDKLAAQYCPTVYSFAEYTGVL